MADHKSSQRAGSDHEQARFFSLDFEPLGKTADDVALALAAQGIRGIRFTVRFLNPVVKFAEAELGEENLQMDVMKGDVLRIVHSDGAVDEMPLPPAVQEFLEGFNRGEYPEVDLAP